MKETNVLIYSKNIVEISKILPKDFTPYIIDGDSIVDDILDSKKIFICFILDAYSIFSQNFNVFNDVKSHPIFKDLPIIVYSNNNTFEIKSKLYSRGIQGIISKEFSRDDTKEYLDRILSKTNNHVGSIDDRFVKSFVEFNHCKRYVNDTLYLANYLIYHYNISGDDAVLIRDAISLIMTSLRNNNLTQSIKFVENMNLSKKLIHILKNYYKPANKPENIVLSSILLNSNELQVDVNSLVDFDDVDSEIYNFAQEVKAANRSVIDSYNDINLFWERMSKILIDHDRLTLDQINIYLSYIFMILNRALINRGGLIAEICPSDNEYLTFKFTPFNCTIDYINQCIQLLNTSKDNIELLAESGDDDRPYILMKIYIENENTCIEDKKPTATTEPIIEKNAEKFISAKEYCAEIEVDNELLEELKESSDEAIDALSFCSDFLDVKSINVVLLSFSRYIKLLNQSIEFASIATALEELRRVLENSVLEDMDSNLKKSINHFLLGIINDFIEWKRHIYIYQDAPDIHYMDESIMDNVHTLSTIINPIEQSGEYSDDLEFF